MSRKSAYLQLGTLLLFFFLALPSAQAMQDILQQASQHLSSGQHQQAYTLLEQHSAEHAGNPQYDYLLGVAALRAGYPGEASFALERVVTTQPDHAAARMELVSAYLQLGMNQQAQAQLAILETQSPPPAARATMDRFQDILRPRLSSIPDPVRVVGLSLGYDDNVGNYPEMDLLGFIPIEPISSTYLQLRGTMWEPIAISNTQRLDLTLHGQYRQHQDSDASQFDLGLIHVAALFNQTISGSSKLGLGIQGNMLWLDGDSFRDHLGLSARWEQRLGPDLRGDAGLEWLNYGFEQSSNDYQQVNLHGRLHKTLNPRLRLSGMLGLEQEMAQGDRFGGDASRWRLQGDANWQLNQRNLASLSLGWSDTRYDEPYLPGLHNPTPNTIKRDDQIMDLSLRWRHIPAKRWEVNSEITYRDQDSSVRFYNSERWTAQMTLMRSF
ncbi:MAG: hypothetical protein IBX49_10305 [Gammaproteobacteria bacterium]|nr:hypothetical protein [Gammaproteobacteria bacterium]